MEKKSTGVFSVRRAAGAQWRTFVGRASRVGPRWPTWRASAVPWPCRACLVTPMPSFDGPYSRKALHMRPLPGPGDEGCEEKRGRSGGGLKAPGR